MEIATQAKYKYVKIVPIQYLSKCGLLSYHWPLTSSVMSLCHRACFCSQTFTLPNLIKVRPHPPVHKCSGWMSHQSSCFVISALLQLKVSFLCCSCWSVFFLLFQKSCDFGLHLRLCTKHKAYRLIKRKLIDEWRRRLADYGSVPFPERNAAFRGEFCIFCLPLLLNLFIFNDIKQTVAADWLSEETNAFPAKELTPKKKKKKNGHQKLDFTCSSLHSSYFLLGDLTVLTVNQTYTFESSFTWCCTGEYMHTFSSVSWD